MWPPLDITEQLLPACVREAGGVEMNRSIPFVTEVALSTLAIYAEMKPDSCRQPAARLGALQRHFGALIKHGEEDRVRLMVSGLRHLHEIDEAAVVTPAWTRASGTRRRVCPRP